MTSIRCYPDLKDGLESLGECSSAVAGTDGHPVPVAAAGDGADVAAVHDALARLPKDLSSHRKRSCSDLPGALPKDVWRACSAITSASFHEDPHLLHGCLLHSFFLHWFEFNGSYCGLSNLFLS